MRKLGLIGLLLFLTIVNPVSGCLSPAQEEGLYNLSLAANISNSTLQSIFTMFCQNDTLLSGRIAATDSYTKSETDIIVNMTRMELKDDIQDIEDINVTVESLAKKHLDNYTTFVEAKLKLVEQLNMISIILNESFKLENATDQFMGNISELWTAIENLRDIVGGLPSKYVTKQELNTTSYTGYTGQIAQPDHTATYLAFFAIMVFGTYYLYATGRLKKLIPERQKDGFKDLSKEDRKKSVAELEKEGKL